MKKVCSIALALLLTLTAAIPAYAGELDALSPAPETVEMPPAEPAEAPAEEPVPEESLPEEPETVEPEEPETVEPEESETVEVEEVKTIEPEEAPAPVANKAPMVNVTVPTTGTITINPYGLPVETVAGISTEQIVSETMDIVNTSEVPVIVSASVEGYVSEQSGAVYVSSPPTADTPEKEIFLYAEFQSEDGQWSESYTGGANQILISTAATELKEVLTLDAAAQGAFRLFGSMTVFPADPWSSEDEISVTFVFTFAPVTAPADIPVLDEKQPDSEESFAPEEPADLPEPPAEEGPADSPDTPVEEEPSDSSNALVEAERPDPLNAAAEEEPANPPETVSEAPDEPDMESAPL